MDRGPYGDMGPDSYVLSLVAKVNGYNWTATGALQGASINSADSTTPPAPIRARGSATASPAASPTPRS